MSVEVKDAVSAAASVEVSAAAEARSGAATPAPSSPGAALTVAPAAAVARGLGALRDYLERIDFIRRYRRLVTPRCYAADPHALRRGHAEPAAGGRRGLGLAACLMLEAPVADAALSPAEQRIAGLLADAGLLARAGGQFQMGAYQLIAARGLSLLIDSRINYPDLADPARPDPDQPDPDRPDPDRAGPRVYIGRDSLLLARHADAAELAPADRVLDLGTGTGLIGLSLARRSSRVTVTDVAPEALALARANRLLNRMTDRVTIRQEPCEETLGRRGRYRVVTFNPPFLPVPDGLAAPVFARGRGRDGLGYHRVVLERLDRILAPDGVAFLMASLLGAADGPFFTEELRRYAAEHGLRVAVRVDSALPLAPGAPVFEAIGALLHRANPAVDRAECQRRAEALQLGALGATRAYLAVLVVRRARGARPSVRVLGGRARRPGARDACGPRAHRASPRAQGPSRSAASREPRPRPRAARGPIQEARSWS